MLSHPIPVAPHQPPFREAGMVRFRPNGPAHQAFEADSEEGKQLFYWSPLVMAHLPIHGTHAVVVVPA